MEKTFLFVLSIVCHMLICTSQNRSGNISPIPIASVSASTVLVTEVVDGDTIRLNTGETVRYIGINAPEIAHKNSKPQCFGVQATDENTRLVLNKRVTLMPDVSDKDKYGRLLRFVWVGNIFVNQLLIRQGFATTDTVPPDLGYKQIFLDAQLQAKQEHLGLWKTCKN